jgi:hypothetical protein
MAPKGETYYSAGMKVSWELDIWGKLKKQQMSREAQRGASQAECGPAISNIVADVAETFNLIGMYDDRRICSGGRWKIARYPSKSLKALSGRPGV